MDNINYLGSLFNHLGLSRRVSALQTRCLEVLPKLSGFRFGRTAFRRTFGVVLIIIALFFGEWANNISRKNILEAWYQENHPSSAIWDHALGSKNFRAVVLPEELGPFLRSLPMTPDRRHEVWVTPDHRSVVLFEDEPKVYTRVRTGEKVSKSNWIPFGAGWRGFDQVCQEIGLETPEVQNPKKRHEPTDPRAIRY